MKTLPYFRWYPADAETDEAYSALDDRELGFFHRCLNRSWVNDGLPTEIEELARTMRVSRSYLDKIWPRVSKLFKEEDGRIFNRRQEEERTHAKTKSEKAAESVRTRYVRTFERSSDDLPRALARAKSVCVSESASEVSLSEGSAEGSFFPARKVVEAARIADASQRFGEFWERYPLKTGQDLACGVWLGLVTISDEAALFACLARYLASDHVARGIVKAPNNWLHDCARDHWACEWPAAQKPNGTARAVDIKAAMLAARKEKAK